MRAEFVTSAAGPGQFPRDGLPEIAFLGRSNVGKSSLINSLIGGRELAFTSRRPGCTRTINFYRVGGQLYFVDLPGYGYAQVPQAETREWKRRIERYLLDREVLRLSIIILDARRGWMESDLQLKRWLEQHQRLYLVVATKVDKLKTQSERQGALARLYSGPGEPLLCSAVTGRGVRELWQAIWKTPHRL